MTANSIVGGQVWLKSKLIEALIVVLDTLKNDEDPSKNESTSVLTQHYFYYKSMDSSCKFKTPKNEETIFALRI